MQRFPIAAVAAMLFVAACSSDTTSPPATHPNIGSISRASTFADATPVNMSIFPNEIVADGTNTTTARVNVDSSIACCDRAIQVSSNNPAVLPFLSSGATVAAGTSFAGIAIDPSAVSQRTVVTIFATGNGVTVSADVILDPPGTTLPPTLSSFSVNPATVNAGTTTIGTVAIPNPAPAGGFVVNLASQVPGNASVPATVTVPAGDTSASFPVSTFTGFPNSTSCTKLVATTSRDFLQTGICVVTGGASTAPALFSLTLGSISVVGGNSTVGTVALTAAAPSGGSVVSLSSANTNVASVPSSVTVPAGASSASFTVNTKTVSVSSTVDISASFAGSTLSTPLSVSSSSSTTPGSSALAAPTLVTPSADARFAVGANITFDWNDVTGAASYELQVDDRDTFPAPLILDRTLTVSQLSTSALPTRTMFWRVRAVSSSGAFGNWSTVRRFEIK